VATTAPLDGDDRYLPAQLPGHQAGHHRAALAQCQDDVRHEVRPVDGAGQVRCGAAEASPVEVAFPLVQLLRANCLPDRRPNPTTVVVPRMMFHTVAATGAASRQRSIIGTDVIAPTVHPQGRPWLYSVNVRNVSPGSVLPGPYRS
jgi:hypothetical protein